MRNLRADRTWPKKVFDAVRRPVWAGREFSTTATNWSVQLPVGRALERNEGLIDDWKRNRWPAMRKAQKEGRTIVFIDESGLSQRPHRRRTWAPRGQTPVLQFHFNWKILSVIAGVTVRNFYVQMFEESIKSEQVIELLEAPAPLDSGGHSVDLGLASG